MPLLTDNRTVLVAVALSIPIAAHLGILFWWGQLLMHVDNFWQGESTCILGGCGMVGLQLVLLLRDAGAKVFVVDDMSHGKNIVEGIDYHIADAGDYDTCLYAFRKADAVFNLAAVVAGVGYNQSHHLEMSYLNTRLQTVPLMAALECRVERFLQVSSACIYDPAYNHPAIEAMPGPEPHPANAGYSWAKRMGERAAGWAVESGLHVVIVRPSNIYGPHDYFDERAHVIPALIKKALFDDQITVNGDGTEIREFLYSQDAARGMMAALEHGRSGEVYNLGTDAATCTTIADLVTLIKDIVGYPNKEVVFVPSQAAGDPKRWSDCRKVYKDCGWQSITSLHDGLQKTIEWYKETKR